MSLRKLVNLKNLATTKLSSLRLATTFKPSIFTAAAGIQKRALSTSTDIKITYPDSQKVKMSKSNYEEWLKTYNGQISVLHQLLQQVEEQKQLIKTSERQVSMNEEHLQEQTKFKITSEQKKITGDLKPEDLKIAESLLKLTQLISQKYGLEKVTGEFNILSPNELKLFFDQNEFYHAQIGDFKECKSSKAFSDLQKIMAATFFLKSSFPYPMAVLSFKHEQCLVAIKALELLKNTSPEDLEKIHGPTFVAKC